MVHQVKSCVAGTPDRKNPSSVAAINFKGQNKSLVHTLGAVS